MTSTLRPDTTESCRFMLEWEGRELRWFVVDVLFLQSPAEGPSKGCCFVTREIGVGVSSRVSYHGSPRLGSCWKTGCRNEPGWTASYSPAVESPHATVDRDWLLPPSTTFLVTFWLPYNFPPHIISPQLSTEKCMRATVTPSECEHAQSGIRMHWFFLYSSGTVSPI